MEPDTLIVVYSDENIRPTVIYDNGNQLCGNFVKNKLVDTLLIIKLKPVSGRNYDESFPPMYTYRAEYDKLFLIAIDTVWVEWK